VGHLTVGNAIRRFEGRALWLTIWAWVFLFLVLVFLAAGAAAVWFAPNITAGDIGIPTTDQKLAALAREDDRISTRIKHIINGPEKDCATAIEATLSQWMVRPSTISTGAGAVIDDVPTGALILQAVKENTRSFQPGMQPIRFLLTLRFCNSFTITFYVGNGALQQMESALPGKTFLSQRAVDEIRELPDLEKRQDELSGIKKQVHLEKTESDLGFLKQSESPKSENDLFLKLLQTTVTRFGLLAVVGFFVSILVSLYRYNVRLAAFYIARADALRLFAPDIQVSDFALIAATLSPTVEFGRAPQPPVAQLVDLIKAGKEAAK
jgi:hypothetical protein